MKGALSIGATGMHAQQMNVEVISNNIANMTTSGYKKQRAEFQDLLYQNIQRPGASSSDSGTLVPSGLQLGKGVKLDSIMRVHSQGSLQVTDNELDLAINGKGFFQILLPNGETAYTRSGKFQINEDGEIVNSDGYELEPGFTIPDDATSVTINPNGEVLVAIDGEIEETNLGQFELSIFPNPAGLEAEGDNLFLETEASGSAVVGSPGEDGLGDIMQGVVELSNVDVVTEITDMISAQRAYEMNSKVIQTADEMLGTLNQIR
mgnify:CR=1 FL=1